MQVPRGTESLTGVPKVIVQVDIMRRGGRVMRFQKLLCRFTQIGLLETARQPTPDNPRDSAPQKLTKLRKTEQNQSLIRTGGIVHDALRFRYIYD